MLKNKTLGDQDFYLTNLFFCLIKRFFRFFSALTIIADLRYLSTQANFISKWLACQDKEVEKVVVF